MENNEQDPRKLEVDPSSFSQVSPLDLYLLVEDPESGEQVFISLVEYILEKQELPPGFSIESVEAAIGLSFYLKEDQLSDVEQEVKDLLEELG